MLDQVFMYGDEYRRYTSCAYWFRLGLSRTPDHSSIEVVLHGGTLGKVIFYEYTRHQQFKPYQQW